MEKYLLIGRVVSTLNDPSFICWWWTTILRIFPDLFYITARFI